ncbi:MAG: ParB/RepB/Spo0J family partition protein [Pseudomonadota bacterium]
MSDEQAKRRLGRGLAALIGDAEPMVASTQPTGVPADRHASISDLAPNPENPRKLFRDEELSDLAQSIRQHGLIQPILVRNRPGPTGSQFEIIAGERRWRAAQMAQLDSVPIIIRDVDDRQSLELAIIENVQRSDLDAVEEAQGYQRLIVEHDYTQNDLAEIIGKSRSHVANTLRLLKLPAAVQAMITSGSLSAGHARTLVTAENPEVLAKSIVDGGLSVRQAEKLATQTQESQDASKSHRVASKDSALEKDADTLALEKTLSDLLGLNVNINHKTSGGGDVRIKYSSLEQLDLICKKLMN